MNKYHYIIYKILKKDFIIGNTEMDNIYKKVLSLKITINLQINMQISRNTCLIQKDKKD